MSLLSLIYSVVTRPLEDPKENVRLVVEEAGTAIAISLKLLVKTDFHREFAAEVILLSSSP